MAHLESCECVSGTATAALELLRQAPAEGLVDESHYLVSIRRCPKCRRAFLSFFYEEIDWVGGEDPQTRVLVPISDELAEALSQRGAALTENELDGLVLEGRYLVERWPSTGERTVLWQDGIVPRFVHD